MVVQIKFILMLVVCAISRNLYAATITNPEWWKHALFYQIYPRSFKDSNNDGIGDIQGIISKLDHLKDAGITATWLSPIYESPQVDQGYDISNYRAIDPDYGTMDDFESLIVEAHKRGIKIIMDFVPNHTSDKHEWFIKSENKTVGYEEFYVWLDGSKDKPPNNWISIFKNSAWKYSDTRQQYYLHQFAEAQPDLNFRSTSVLQEIRDVLEFWLDKGVDGFRMDAIPYLFEEENFRDEPRSNDPNAPNNTHGYLRHVYTQDQPETIDLIYKWRKVLDEYNKAKGGDPRIMMTEAYTDITTTMYYYGNAQSDGAHFTFNFFLILDLNEYSTAGDVAYTIEKWLKNMPKKYAANWVIGNHDINRVATRFGQENVDAYNMLAALLPGIMVTYNGEEIGQEDGEVTFEQGKDPNACNGPKEEFAAVTRDVGRTPYQWDNSTNAGFNTGAEPWLPVSSKYSVTNLAAQQNPNAPSHYQVFKQLSKLRLEMTFRHGDVKITAVNSNVLMFSRSHEGYPTYLVILNLSVKSVTININDGALFARQYSEIVISSVTSSRKKGDLIGNTNLQLEAHESLVVVATSRVTNNCTTTDSSQAESSTTTSRVPKIECSLVIVTLALVCAEVLRFILSIN